MRFSAPPVHSPHARWTVLALLFAISVVTYVDRVNISVTARQMMPAFGLTDGQMGRIFSAFVLGYALFQIPGGWLGDRWGARRVLTAAVLWWSLFTALTAVAATLPLVDLVGIAGSLALVRFLLGIGEAAALPNFNRAVADWLDPQERGLGIGIAIGGIGVGSALTPPIAAWLMVNFGWQTVFYWSTALGLLIAGLWYWYTADHSARQTQTTGSERREGPASRRTGGETSVSGKTPWKAIAATPTVWWLVLSYSCLGYVAYVYMSWFYLYLVNVRGFGELRGAVFASAPFLAILVFCPLGGWVTDRLAAAYGVRKGRSAVGMTGMLLSGTVIALGATVDSAWIAILCLSLGAGWLYFTVGAYWASTADLSKAHAGTLSGLMNTGANLGGSLSPTLTPWLAEQWGWPVSLGVAALIAILGGLMWLKIDPGKGLRGSE